MKVLCIKLLNAHGRETSRSSRLTLGRTYQALELMIDVSGCSSVRIVGDTEYGSKPTPTVHRLAQFEIIENTMPQTWRVHRGNQGGMVFAPEPWQEDSFWVRFFDGEPAAVASFEAERAKMYDVDPPVS